MGPNAVADAIAQKYNATKSQVFDHVSEKPLCGVVFMASFPGQLSGGRQRMPVVLFAAPPLSPPLLPRHRLCTVPGHRTYHIGDNDYISEEQGEVGRVNFHGLSQYI